MELLVIITVWFVFGVVGGLIGQQHGKTGKGFALGFFLGPIGWALMLFDVSLFSLLLTFLAVGLIGYFVGLMIYEGNRSAEQKRKKAEAEAFEQANRDDSDQPQQPDAILKSVTAPLPSPTPRRTPTPQELAAQQAQENQRRAAEIFRKYSSPK